MFENVLLLSISRNYLQTSFQIIYFWENLHCQILEIFLIDHYAGDIRNKNITGKYLKNSSISVNHLVQVSQFTIGAISITHVIYPQVIGFYLKVT